MTLNIHLQQINAIKYVIKSFFSSHYHQQQEDHAICCAEMGLSMIETMKIFDAERHEGIKMRVGIHTGKFFSSQFVQAEKRSKSELMEFLSECPCQYFFLFLSPFR